MSIASRSNKISYFRLANGQLYCKAQEKKQVVLQLWVQFVWKEIKILGNKNILALVFKIHATRLWLCIGGTNTSSLSENKGYRMQIN